MNRCPQCMNEWDAAQCSFCGYEKGDERPVTGALPSGMQIENRYTLGNALSSSRQSIGYVAWDARMNTRVLVEEFFPAAIVSRGADGRIIIKRNKEQFARARALFLDAPLEGIRPLKCSHSFDTLNTAMRVYPLDEHQDALTRMEELLDAPILFRDPAGSPLMSINGLLIPPLPKSREYKLSSYFDKNRKRRSLVIALISLIAVCVIGIALWAGYTMLSKYSIEIKLNAPYSAVQTWMLSRVEDGNMISVNAGDIQSDDTAAFAKLSLRRGNYSINVAQDGKEIARTVFAVEGAQPSEVALPTYTPVPVIMPTPSPVPSVAPSPEPSVAPSPEPSVAPSPEPSVAPFLEPSVAPFLEPSVVPWDASSSASEPSMTIWPASQPAVEPESTLTPSPAEEPLFDSPSILVYIDAEGIVHAYQYSKEIDSANDKLSVVDKMFPVNILLNVEPIVYDGVFIHHIKSGNKIKLPDNKSIKVQLPAGEYELYMQVKDKKFLPYQPKDGIFEVGSELNSSLGAFFETFKFDELELDTYFDYSVEAFKEGDFVYAVDNVIYKDTLEIPEYKINKNDKIDISDPDVVIKNQDLSNRITLISTEFNLGIPDIYRSLFLKYEFIIRKGQDKKSINLSENRLKQLSMLPGDYTIEKVDMKDETLDLWDGEPVPFTISEKEKSINLGLTYEDLLRMTGTFLLIQDNETDSETKILPDGNSLGDDPNGLKEIENDLISHAAEVRMYDAYMDWNEDFSKMMEDEEVHIYLNGNEINKNKEIKLSQGKYQVVIKTESTGWKNEIKSQLLSLPSKATSYVFSFDEDQLKDVLRNYKIYKAEPDWLFGYNTEYYKVVDMDGKSIASKTTKERFDEYRTKEKFADELPVDLAISYSAELDIPEGLRLRVTPVKGDLKRPGEVLIGSDAKMTEVQVKVSGKPTEQSQNNDPTTKITADPQELSQTDFTEPKPFIVSIYPMSKIKTNSLELTLVSKEKIETGPFIINLNQENTYTPVSVTFMELRDIYKDLSLDASEFILKAKDENQSKIHSYKPTEDMYALLQDGKYILEAVRDESDPVKRTFTIENGKVTVTPEDDNNSGTLK